MDISLNVFSSNKVQREKDEQHIRVLILGSGPAGLAAALYAARAELQPVVLTGSELGGQVSLTNTVENYPGFPEGVGGTELVELFQKQAEKFGARVELDTAEKIDLSEWPFKIETYQHRLFADTLIVATGATPIHLGVPGEKELVGRGVSYCATCDGFFFKNKDVVVVGGGDSALEESLFLTRYANTITLIHRRDSFRASAVLQKRVAEDPKIKVVWNNVVTKILGEATMKGVQIKNVITGEESELQADGIFIFIGHAPNTQLFAGQLEMDEHNYIKTNQRAETTIPGVFVAGEAADPNFRQVITSAGIGAAAAIQAIRFVQEKVVAENT